MGTSSDPAAKSEDRALPDHLPGEPPPRVWTTWGTAGVLLRKVVGFLVVATLSLPFWPIYLLLRLAQPRPPIFPSTARTRRCLRLVLTERPEPPLTAAMRLGLTLEVLRRTAANGPLGCAWFLDELLYGRVLERVRIVAPVFEISASRSGSTQLARYLEDDPEICAPSLAQIAFPFLWLWKLSPALSRLVSAARFERFVLDAQPPEFLERHEMSPLRTDTFEVAFQVVHHYGDVMHSLGPGVLDEELRYGAMSPPTREMWEADFLRFLDTLGRKTLVYAARGPNDRTPRLMIKGHFLLVAAELERRYPDARFLTVVRAPDKRLQSVVNFLRCQATISPCPAMAWNWVVPHALAVEEEYCRNEMDWFRRSGARRTVIPFDAYVRDLEGTMRTVYRDCLDAEPSPHVPRTHSPRERGGYSVDRSLTQLGVDAEAFNRRLEAYQRWSRGEPVSS